MPNPTHHHLNDFKIHRFDKKMKNHKLNHPDQGWRIKAKSK